MERQKRIERLLPSRELPALCPWNKITNTHDFLLYMKLVFARIASARKRHQTRRGLGRLLCDLRGGSGAVNRDAPGLHGLGDLTDEFYP
jgi:hypothetical protein